MWKTVKKNINIIKTSNIYLSLLTLGMSIAVTGPCLLDLQRLVNTDTQHIAFIYTSRSLGYLVGAILGGVVLNLVRSKMLVLAVCNLFVTVTMLGIPWSRSVEILLGFAVVNGFTLGVIETGGNMVIIQLWGTGPILQALHFTFAVGSFIAPLIAAPFVEDQTKQQNLFNNTNYTSFEYLNANTTANFSETTFHDGVAKMTYPFSIIGILALLVTFLFFATLIISPYEDSGSKTEEEDNSTMNCCFMFCTIIFTFLVFFVLIGTEIGFGQTLASYTVKGKLKTTAVTASYMTSAYWSAFMTMRLACVFLSIKFSSLTLVAADIFLVSVAGVMLLFCMPNEGVLWAAVVIYGAGTASIYASLIGWLDNYITITNKISAILIIGCAAGEMVIPFIISFFMESIPEMLAYVVAGSSVVSVALLLILYAFIRKGKKNNPPKETECYVISNEAVIS